LDGDQRDSRPRLRSLGTRVRMRVHVLRRRCYVVVCVWFRVAVPGFYQWRGGGDSAGDIEDVAGGDDDAVCCDGDGDDRAGFDEETFRFCGLQRVNYPCWDRSAAVIVVAAAAAVATAAAFGWKEFHHELESITAAYSTRRGEHDAGGGGGASRRLLLCPRGLLICILPYSTTFGAEAVASRV